MLYILIALFIWLHSLATLVLIGHYLLLALIYLPTLAKKELETTRTLFLSDISRRSRVWLYASVLTFIVTGIYLMLVDPNYLGFGDFGNLWGILMLVKHLLILGMVAMGFWFNAIWRVGPQMSSKSGASIAYGRFRTHVYWMAIAGVLVLLLTALAQVE